MSAYLCTVDPHFVRELDGRQQSLKLNLLYLNKAANMKKLFDAHVALTFGRLQNYRGLPFCTYNLLDDIKVKQLMLSCMWSRHFHFSEYLDTAALFPAMWYYALRIMYS